MVGLGDRHGENILLDQQLGTVFMWISVACLTKICCLRDLRWYHSGLYKTWLMAWASLDTGAYL
uniref:Uncharacterized protein n=1 Tax=Oryza brachyantha TaxID=4533 RepID=J3LKD1_ORYBR